MLAYIPYMDPVGMAAVSFRKLIGGQISSEASLLPGLCGGAGKPTGHQSCNRSGEFPSFSEFGIQSLMDLIDRNRFNWHMKTTWPENTGYIVIWICIYIIYYILHYIGYIITLYSMDMIQRYPMTLDLPQQDQGRCPVLVAPWHEDANIVWMTWIYSSKWIYIYIYPGSLRPYLVSPFGKANV